MDWNNIERMDPDLLVGVVNTALRNEYGSLEELCKSHSIDKESLCQRLAENDYEYMESVGQFR
ncbi:DUF4250 domain-containing protein [Pelagicoccus sp. SDUM812003]|uniref:DUF4250 domain-containing protein n=1 Tax=Pelagicoccus sp. SDUM812003 TaxID=3041267 RepID=UPI00280DBE6E|nr:DUF4250 domain-containing protein [Pelagicoccus sp. SDUM812003]MDQ8201779.1 DUF4250 domain-containing protein [Pelagicoccus sp. SDUM812003]